MIAAQLGTQILVTALTVSVSTLVGLAWWGTTR